ncbi:hypothetical protein LXL04_032335 [Taraxacum kok-saghyz]
MQVSKITKIIELDPQRLDFTIKVRVLRKWNIRSKYNPNEVWLTEMILMDEEGDVIQSTLFKNLLHKFQGQLLEGFAYLIVSPTLRMKNETFLLREQQNKINFLPTTIVINSPNFTTTGNGFSFADFPLILSDHFPTNQFIDVIGAVVEKPIMDTSKQRHLLEIKLQNFQFEHSISCKYT